MRRAFPLALCLLLLSASLTFAQAVTSGTGAINGRVSDASQAVMPGVTITLTSPVLVAGSMTGVTDAGGDVEVLASHDGVPVLLRQGRFLVASFHPELTGDTRVHEKFLELVREESGVRA